MHCHNLLTAVLTVILWKCPRAVPSMEHWGLFQMYCPQRVDFILSAYICLLKSPLAPNVTFGLQCKPLLSHQHLEVMGTWVCCHLHVSRWAEQGWAPNLWVLKDLMIHMQEHKCFNVVYGRHMWRTVSIPCSSCSSLISKAFPGSLWITFSYFKCIICTTARDVKHVDEKSTNGDKHVANCNRSLSAWADKLQLM